MHKISVIIPVYNVEHYLPQCLDSVINQTYQNLEIIVVNDGSTDSCPQICDVYATRDKRIKVIHKRNGGLSDARNAGMNCTTGELISFVDSDDLLSPYFFQKLCEALITHSADIAECEFKKFFNPRDIDFILNNTNSEVKELQGEKIIEALLKGPLHVMVWNKLYKKEVVHDMLFPVNRLSEDVFWTYKVYGEAAKVVKIEDELYFYRQREKSIMGSKYSINRLDSLDAYEEKIAYIKKKFPNLLKDVNKSYCFILIYNYIQLKTHSEVDPNMVERTKIFEKIETYNKISEMKYWNWKDVIWYKLFLFSPHSYMLVRKYMDNRSNKVKTND